jgi:hypothetical protein
MVEGGGGRRGGFGRRRPGGGLVVRCGVRLCGCVRVTTAAWGALCFALLCFAWSVVRLCSLINKCKCIFNSRHRLQKKIIWSVVGFPVVMVEIKPNRPWLLFFSFSLFLFQSIFPSMPYDYTALYKGNISGGSQPLRENYENLNLSHMMLIQQSA